MTTINTQQAIRLIETAAPMTKVLHALIDDHAPRRAEMIRLYNAYRGEVPIKQRRFEDTSKINRKLANDYRGDIIDTIVGYLFGNPITYSIDRAAYEQGETINETAFDRADEKLQLWRLRNAVADLDSETGKKAAICGYGARLLYVDPEGQERVMNVDPWECIFIADASHDEPQYAMRYYKVEVMDGDTSVERWRVEWYTATTVAEYQEDEGGVFVLEDERPHLFDAIPLIEFPNNDERMGDFEKVESLIDAYDRTTSDSQNEIEEFRLAYLLSIGAEVDADTVEQARRTGTFNVPDEGDMRFLTKDVLDTFIENHKDTLNANIYKFSKTVDMSDEKFSGASQTGESRKWKLLSLENRAVVKERKFERALRQQFRVLTSAWERRGIVIDEFAVDWQFDRNLPVELKHEAEVTGLLRGHVSERTRLSQLSFVPDVEWELQQMQQEQEERVALPDDDEEDEEA